MDGAALLAGPAVGRTLAGVAPGELLSWQVRTLHDRRDGATASYRARVRDAAGERSTHLAATTRPLPGGAPGGVHAWAWPHDPWLPGLGAACRPSGVAGLLGPHVDPAGLHLQVRTYRPGRRAVVEATAGAARWFVKVLPPGEAVAVAARHEVIAAAGLPVARVLARGEDGRLLLEALPGTPARERLRTGGPAPSGASLVALTERLPRALLDLPARRSWSDGAPDYGAALARVLRAAGRPDDAVRAERLAARVEAVLTASAGPPEPVHGDLYEGQLLVDPAGGVCGLLDVDRAGPGRRADDLACALAHLDVLALLPGWPTAPLRARRAEWQATAARAVDPLELAARTAGVLLSLATGPHRVQEPDWLAATAAWLAAAEQALVRR